MAGPYTFDPRRLCFALAVIAVTPLAAQIVRDQRGPGIVDRGIVIPRAMFSHGYVKQLAQEFLEREAKSSSLARLLIAVDEQSLQSNYAHGTPNNTYVSTVADINRFGILWPECCRLEEGES